MYACFYTNAGNGRCDGVNLNAVGKSIIDEVRYMVTKTTGTEVRGVNVFIDSIKLEKHK